MLPLQIISSQNPGIIHSSIINSVPQQVEKTCVPHTLISIHNCHHSHQEVKIHSQFSLRLLIKKCHIWGLRMQAPSSVSDIHFGGRQKSFRTPHHSHEFGRPYQEDQLIYIYIYVERLWNSVSLFFSTIHRTFS